MKKQRNLLRNYRIKMKITFKELYESVVNDSRIDFPQETLPLEVWDKTDGKYSLKSDVKDTLLKAVKLIKKNREFNKLIGKTHIVGSICSNQYTTTSDIDIHFTIKAVPANKTIEELNDDLVDYMKDHNKELYTLFIDTHPVTFYFQINEYQDLMSAGVYDIDTEEWIVGPNEVALDFNPYIEYADAFPIVGSYIKKIETILTKINQAIAAYNTVYAEDKKSDKLVEIRTNIFNEIKNLLSIKKELKIYRRSYSAPTSEEEAEKGRIDKNWARIDAVFKFMDKFGYLRKIVLITRLIDNVNEINNNDIEKLKGYLQ